MKPEDEAACAEIMSLAVRRAFHWTQVAEMDGSSFRALTAGEAVLVAAIADRIVGFAGVYRPDNFLHHLYVTPAFQGRGVGRVLLQAVREMLGCRAALKCQVKNEIARKFYRANGWTEDDGIGGEDEYGQWVWIRLKPDNE